MANPVVQWQLPAKDPEGVSRFYSKLFGWKISSDNALCYRRADAAGGGIGGGFWPSPPEGHSLVQLFIQVANVSAHVEKAVGLGAQVMFPPQKLPDGDELAILLGPEGVSFGLVKSNSAARA